MNAKCLLTAVLFAASIFAQEYFPPGSLAATTYDHEFLASWYSKHLKALEEPSVWHLSLQKPPVEVYRFLYLRSFDHPIAVRLSIAADGTGALTSKETNGAGGYEPGSLIRNRTVKLSEKRVESFREKVEELGFWKLPTWPEPDEKTVGVDGAQWILEAAEGGRYHVVDRWSPHSDDPIHKIATMLMIDMARFEIPHRDVY
jgi:hypothetical protein